MLIRAKSIINLPVIEMIGLKKISFIRDILVDPDNGAIIALILKRKSILDSHKVVTMRDIANLFADAVLVQNTDMIVGAHEVLKTKEILEKRIFLLKSRVITADGKFLGYLEDFVFDHEFSQLMTLVVKKRFSQERRIISAERIINILPRKIIIRDAGIKMPVIEKGKLAGVALGN